MITVVEPYGSLKDKEYSSGVHLSINGCSYARHTKSLITVVEPYGSLKDKE